MGGYPIIIIIGLGAASGLVGLRAWKWRSCSQWLIVSLCQFSDLLCLLESCCYILQALFLDTSLTINISTLAVPFRIESGLVWFYTPGTYVYVSRVSEKRLEKVREKKKKLRKEMRKERKGKIWEEKLLSLFSYIRNFENVRRYTGIFVREGDVTNT